MSQSKCQVLITGVYRTGSEYFSHIVNCHPGISVSLYGVNALRFIYHKYTPIYKMNNYLKALNDLENRLQTRYNLNLNKSEILAELERIEKITYGAFYDIVMSSLYLNNSVKIWAEKNQLLWREIPEFLNSLPNGKAILILRDPRSILLSFKKFTYAPSPAYLGAIFNSFDAMKHALKYIEALDNNAFLLVRYEDFARNPEKYSQKTWEFIGLKGNYNVRNQSNWYNAEGQPWYANSSFQSNIETSKFDVESSINRWKKNLSLEEIALTELVCGKLMKVFGYELVQPQYNEDVIYQLINDDKIILTYFNNWKNLGVGIEAFPTDPLLNHNWRNASNTKYNNTGE